MRLLVTGGAGFIGSDYVRMTLGEHPEDTVVVLDKLTYAGNERNLDVVRSDPRFRFVKGDIADAETVGALARDADVIVNFAAESHVDRSLEAPGQFILTDVYGTYVLLEAARVCRHERFLQVSTDEVYGDVPTGRSREGDPLRPRSPYSASKAAVSSLMRSFACELAPYGIRANAVLPGIVSTGMARRQWDEDPDYRHRAEETIALGELQDPSSVADLFLFLCSDMASYMTGSALLVDGGCSIGKP